MEWNDPLQRKFMYMVDIILPSLFVYVWDFWGWKLLRKKWADCARQKRVAIRIIISWGACFAVRSYNILTTAIFSSVFRRGLSVRCRAFQSAERGEHWIHGSTSRRLYHSHIQLSTVCHSRGWFLQCKCSVEYVRTCVCTCMLLLMLLM